MSHVSSVASVLVTRGCMMLGSHVISGTTHAKIRLMRDSSGSSVKEAYPGMVVTVSGWKDLPSVGDEVLEGTEANVKKAVANRIRKAEAESTLVDLGAINAQRRQERELREGRGGDKQAPVETVQGPKELRIVIKGDVSGSVEAVDGALQGLGNKHAVVKVVSTGVGEVSESDVMMAKAAEGSSPHLFPLVLPANSFSPGMIIAFGVSTTRSVESKAAQSGVPIHSSTIIYRVMDHIKECLVALLPPIIEQRVVGEATVLQMFDIRLKAKETMKVAGCRVINGILEKARDVRVMRDGEAIFHGERLNFSKVVKFWTNADLSGSVETMRFLKKDVTEIRKGSECGLKLQKFDDLREGDLIQAYQVLEMPGTL
jgi:translation initiation factor IF-2